MQIADRNVDKLLERLESESNARLSAGLLTPEQAERLTAISRETDPRARAELVNRLTEQLLSELDDANARLDAANAKLSEVRGRLGQSDEGGLLEGDRLSPEARARVRDAIERNAEEVRRQASMQADLHSGKADQGSPPPGGAVYV